MSARCRRFAPERGPSPKTASLRLHEKAGFRVVGIRHHIGHHHDHWRDVILLERRSAVTGLWPPIVLPNPYRDQGGAIARPVARPPSGRAAWGAVPAGRGSGRPPHTGPRRTRSQRHTAAAVRACLTNDLGWCGCMIVRGETWRARPAACLRPPDPRPAPRRGVRHQPALL
ncbi:hypothetical protein B1L11_13670 [Microbispora sp. GKU 823]|nr:hypothetical protein B1L11_13670 [Microbispora sp. GKU 823]